MKNGIKQIRKEKKEDFITNPIYHFHWRDWPTRVLTQVAGQERLHVHVAQSPHHYQGTCSLKKMMHLDNKIVQMLTP